jgi:hypothetical protein
MGVTDLDFVGSVDIWLTRIGSLQAATDPWPGPELAPAMLVPAQRPQQMLQRRSKLFRANAGVCR